MNTARERHCSVCLRWYAKTGKGWTTDQFGAWICPRCSVRKQAA